MEIPFVYLTKDIFQFDSIVYILYLRDRISTAFKLINFFEFFQRSPGESHGFVITVSDKTLIFNE